MPRTARVALDLPLPEPIDYLAGDVDESDLGRLVQVEFGRRRQVGVLVQLSDGSALADERLKPLLAVRRDLPPLTDRWLALAAFCAGYFQQPLGQVIGAALPPGLKRGAGPGRERRDPRIAINDAGIAAIAGLRARSIGRRILEAVQREGPLLVSQLRPISPQAAGVAADLLMRGLVDPVLPATPADAPPPLLPEQAEAVDAVAAAFGRFAPFLLHGVTGSGKTEVYLRLAEQALARGGQALLLVPEIALTPQLEARVAARFPQARLVSLHSGMPEGARSRGFLAALWGEADLVLGTRLSVFTPLPRLALIVIDEEHDTSFKQQEAVRYSARDLAVYRAKLEGVPVVLGSATPSLESWHHAAAGRYALLRLPRRAVAENLPRVRCIDTSRMKLEQGLAPPLLEALQACLERGEQALVFLNRRGYAPVLACPACAWVSRCRHCAANQVLHLADRRLRCHHCGAQTGVPAACPDCGNQDLRPFGRGTQRLEAALAERFPRARVLRVDRDSAGTPARWQAILEAIRAGEADILVGTQMLAKGHDFPRLTLVGVLNADASLFAADFRAPERLFAQLMQVGGRSGRAELPGEVLIQTDYPGHPLYGALAAHDYPRFADAQLAERRQAGFPPYSFQALLAADAPQLAQALAFLGEAAAAARGPASDAIRIYDPVPMRLVRRADRERAQLLVESPQRPALQAFLPRWLQALRALRVPRQVRWHVDVDPLEF